LEVTIYIVNSYFDYDDYNEPVKTYLDDRFTYTNLPGMTKASFIYIQ